MSPLIFILSTRVSNYLNTDVIYLVRYYLSLLGLFFLSLMLVMGVMGLLIVVLVMCFITSKHTTL